MAGRTSLSALRVQTPYVTARIPPKRMAVLDFQFEGRVHQPPIIADTPTKSAGCIHRDHSQPSAGYCGKTGLDAAPAGDQTSFG